MKRSAVCLVLVLTSAVAAMGCKSKPAQIERKTISMDDTSVAAQVAFESDHPAATVMNVGQETLADGTIQYEFNYADANGKRQQAWYGADGKPLPPR